MNHRFLPFWEIPQYKIKKIHDLLRAEFQNASKYVINEFKKSRDKGFGNLERTFWGLLSAYYLNSVSSLDVKSIEKYIFQFRSSGGGFFSESTSVPDVHSTFFAIYSLRILGFDLNEDEKQITVKFLLGNHRSDGFSHCTDKNCKKCGGKTSLKSTFYAIASLYLLDRLNELDLNLVSKYLSKRLPKSDINNSLIILADFLVEGSARVDDVSYLLEFQKEDGSFCEKEEGEEDLENTFWVISCLSAINLNFNRGIIFDKFLQKLHRKDGGYNKQPLNTESDLIDTAQAISITSLIIPELSEQIENDILRSIDAEKELYLINIADKNFIDEKFVLKILRNLQEYNWFTADLIQYKDLIDSFLKKLGSSERNLTEKIIKKLRKMHNTSIDLGEFAKSLKIPVSQGSSYLPSEDVVKKSINKLLEYKFVIGELEEARKRLKKTTYLKLQFIPSNVLVRRQKFDLDEVLKEKDNISNVDKHIKELSEAAIRIPEEFRMEIKNLLDIDEVELAREKLETSYNQKINNLEDYDKSIKFLKNSFNYIKVDILDSYQNWLQLSKNVEDKLADLKKQLEKNIAEKEKLIEAYNNLNELVNYVDENISTFNEDMDNLNSFFIDTCRLHNLDKKKQDILVKISALEDNIKKIAKEVQDRSKQISHITNKVKFLKNVIISDDLSISKRIVTHELKEKLQPFESWLENQWDAKRHLTSQKLEIIRSKIHKREELQNIIESKKKTFKVKLEEIPRQIQQYIDGNKYQLANEKLNGAINDILNFLSETVQFIHDFITDTNTLLEDFELTAEDIPLLWNDSTEQMREELIKMKNEVLKQIVSEQELDEKKQLDDSINKNIDEVSKKLTEISTLSKMDHEKITTNMKDFLKSRIKEIEDFCGNANDEISTFIKNTVKSFPNFNDTINISIHKWQTFLNSLSTVFNQVYDQTLSDFTINLIKSLSRPENGGRVNLEDLSRILGLNVGQVKNLLVKQISVSKLEAKMEDKQIIPLYTENKMQLQFEELIIEFKEELNLNFEKFSNFFITSYERKQLDNNESEIRERIKEFKNSINNYDVEIKVKFENQIKNPYNEQLLLDWGNLKSQLNSKLENVTRILETRNEYNASFLEKIQHFRDKLGEISKTIINKIEDRKELPKLISKLSAKEDDLRLEIIDQRNLFKNNIIQLTKDIEHFDKIIDDGYANFISESEKILLDLKNLKRKLEDKILEKQCEAEKEKLREKIQSHSVEFKELVDIMDKEVYNIIETGNLSEAATTLKQTFDDNKNYIKTVDNSITEFLKINSRVYRGFKDTCVLILRDWNPEELENHLKKAFNVLQDRIVIRNVEYAERAFHGNRIKIDVLASKISMKSKVFKERLFDILGTSEELKGKYDVRTNEYIFRPDEEPKAVSTTTTLPVIPQKKTFFDVMREWASFFTILGGTAGVAAAIYTITRNVGLTILVFSIILPIGIIIMLIYYKLTKR
ncbi:MAG: prenyltransferase/squalene oxidase repeat-containing protein [Promethearchaeota archaeon]